MRLDAGRPDRGTKRSRRRVWAGAPGVRGRRRGLGTRRRTAAQGGGCFGDAESVRALSTLDFAYLGRSALLARTLFGC